MPAYEFGQDFGPQLAILIIAADHAGADAAEQAVAAAGARTIRVLPIEAIGQNETWPIADALFLDLGADTWPEPLGDVLRAARRPTVIAFGSALIDQAAAATLDLPDCTLLCDPDPIERTAALALALSLARRDPWLADIGSGSGDTLRLRQLSEEVGRIARTLAGLSGSAAPAGGPGEFRDPGSQWGRGRALDANAIRAMIRARRIRAQFFDEALFADPAWDMLLDLMAARIERRPVAVSSLCIAAAVPSTTALRWIKALTEQGLMHRVPDPRDARRVFIELDDAAAITMARCLEAMAATAALPA